MFTDRPYLITSACPEANNKPVEIHDLVQDNYTKQTEAFKLTASQMGIKDDIKNSLMDAKSWLPYASESLNISPRIEDYIMVPVVIMPSDLPNRNGFGFPMEELTRWNTDSGRIAYQTFTGKPTHEEHDNKDPGRAKGVNFSTAFRPITGCKGKLYKLITLCGFDRTRDPHLVNEILSGRRNSYSMGAYCKDYRCSVSGNLHSQGGSPYFQLGKWRAPVINGKLAFYEAVDPVGFEVSSVAVPAYSSAVNNKWMSLN